MTYTVHTTYVDPQGVEQIETQTFDSRKAAAAYANEQMLWESTRRVESDQLRLARSGDFC